MFLVCIKSKWYGIPTCVELDGPPMEEELESVQAKLKNGKAGGKTGTFAQVVRYGAELWDRMLMEKVWEEQSVVRDWKDTKIVPIPRPLSM